MRPVKDLVPLTRFAILLALASAALCVAQTRKPSEQPDRSHKVIASGRLIGNSEVQQISVARSNGSVRLTIESVTSPPKIVWETNGHNAETKIDSVRIADLDGDGVPEILTLWWKGAYSVLRVFHWDTRQRSFAEITSNEEIDNVRSYRTESNGRTTTRLVVASSLGRDSEQTTREYELRNSRLVRTIGGQDIKTTDESGIEGQAIISPSHPGPVRQGESGTAPFKTTIAVWDTVDGREVARVETDSDGRFRVALRPGTYRVGSPRQTGRILPRAGEETVSVTAGKFAKVTINFDSGMR